MDIRNSAKGEKSNAVTDTRGNTNYPHVKVKGDSSPYNGDLVYWSIRMGTHPEATKRVATLLKRQKGKCTYCGFYFREEDVLEVDHITPKAMGGKDEYKNLQILHRHCHDVKTTEDGSVEKYT